MVRRAVTSAGLFAFVAAAVLAWWLTPRMGRIAAARGIVARPSPRGVHRTPTPVSGGATIVVSAAVVLAAPWSRAVLPAWIVVPSLLVALLGALDDALDLRWTTKLALEIAIAMLALWLDGRRSVDAHAVLAIGWLVLVTNAMNFIDNMDGLAPGTAAIALLAIAAVAMETGAGSIGVLALAVAGACAAFFWLNFSRGAAFLGDCGSLFLGFVAAATSMSIADRAASPVAYAPLLVLGYPVFDVVFVVARRCASRKSPVVGGTDHTSHALAARLGGTRSAVVCLLAASSVIASAAISVAVIGS
jgi:UDP-GlcNAc:undecaprenyl-phosphate GlcNAc-1-phosphate transferase